MAEIRVELITIGREILDGRVVDTNAVRIAEALRPLGLIPRFGQRVDDQLERVIEAFRIASARSQVILVTGGLGPTSDDLTAEAFARFMGEEPTPNPEALAQIEAYLRRASRPFIEAQRKQAMIAPSCFVIPNPEGTAPGFGLERDGTVWFFMPGVPREMLRMLREQVIPRLPRRESYCALTWVTQFTAESGLQQRLTPIEKRLAPGFEITYQTRFPENHIGLCGDCDTPDRVRLFDELAREIDALLGPEVYSRAGAPWELRSLESVVAELLVRRGEKVYAIEEITGGLISERLSGADPEGRAFLGSTVLAPGAVAGSLEDRALRLAAEAILKLPPRSAALVALGDADAVTGVIALARPGQAPSVTETRTRVGIDRERFRVFLAQRALDTLRLSL